MKIKIDFVTNSSSASFKIPLSQISEIQLELLKSHYDIGKIIAKKNNINLGVSKGDTWKIIISKKRGCVYGTTTMDNFDMIWFLGEIGINEENVEYKDHIFIFEDLENDE